MRFLLLILSIFFLFSCKSNQKENFSITPSNTSDTLSLAKEAQKAMEAHCYLCHSPYAAENEGRRVGPPMIAIKAHYLEQFPSRDLFVAAMVDFVEHPTNENALLSESVAKYGLMPRQQFPEGMVEQIATYLYDYQIEAPNWFTFPKGKAYIQTGKENPLFTTKEVSPEEKALNIALATKQELGKNLMGAIQSKGTLHALEFCHVKALPITDSLAKLKYATIQRVSDKNRNPKNKANAMENALIADFQKQIKNQKEPQVVKKTIGNKNFYYYPIVTNTMCLQCHGKKENMTSDVFKKIQLLYPSDLAIGYGENQVRGIWKIGF